MSYVIWNGFTKFKTNQRTRNILLYFRVENIKNLIKYITIKRICPPKNKSMSKKVSK